MFTYILRNQIKDNKANQFIFLFMDLVTIIPLIYILLNY